MHTRIFVPSIHLSPAGCESHSLPWSYEDSPHWSGPRLTWSLDRCTYLHPPLPSRPHRLHHTLPGQNTETKLHPLPHVHSLHTHSCQCVQPSPPEEDRVAGVVLSQGLPHGSPQNQRLVREAGPEPRFPAEVSHQHVMQSSVSD